MPKNKKDDLKDLQESPKSTESKNKTQTVKFLEMVRGSYGAFDTGDIAVIPAFLAQEFLISGVVEIVKESPSATKTEEEFI